MTRVVWITGRAATGKSTLLAACLAKLRAAGHDPLCLCDEDLLLKLKRADTTHAHHVHPFGDRRFGFRDGYLFDEGLRSISATVLAAIDAAAPTFVLVELARGTAHPPVDVTWRHALDLIDARIWPRSIVIHLQVPTAVQRHRNRQRGVGGRPHTPEEIMGTLYAHDDPESLLRAGVDVRHIPHALAPEHAASVVLRTLGTRPDSRTSELHRVKGPMPQHSPALHPVGRTRRYSPADFPAIP